MTPEEAEAEINKLKGPQGSVVLLSKAKQVWVTDHASKLQTIYEMIQAVENPQAPPLSELKPRALAASILTERGPDRSNATLAATWLSGVTVIVLLIA